MRFDWKKFCDDYGVPYVTDGANVSRGNINISCPFCHDPSEHLGLCLDPKQPKWGCWRCKQAGKAPGFLVSKLLQSRTKADRAIADQQQINPDDFDGLFEHEEDEERAEIRTTKVLPKNLRDILEDKSYCGPAVRYLAKRGFDDPERLARRYSLKYAVTGDYAQRVVMPVMFEGRLVSWVGRALGDKAKVRYKTEDSGDLKRLISNYDVLMKRKSKALFICEGPFDYLKVDYYARAVGGRATCTFGTAWTQEQLALLRRVLKLHPNAHVLYDRGASMEAMRLSDNLEAVCGRAVPVMELTGFASDPGELTERAVHRLVERATLGATDGSS